MGGDPYHPQHLPSHIACTSITLGLACAWVQSELGRAKVLPYGLKSSRNGLSF